MHALYSISLMAAVTLYLTGTFNKVSGLKRKEINKNINKAPLTSWNGAVEREEDDGHKHTDGEIHEGD